MAQAPPFVKKDDAVAGPPDRFAKKGKGKPFGKKGRSAPAQKALRQGSRPPSFGRGGSR